jgi:hypothetical protein
LSDVTPDNEWIPGANYAAEGHQEFPRALYKRMPPETQKVFDRATSGRLYLGVDNRRHEFDRLHREYNEATGQLLQRFMGEQNIREPEQMTPNHARAVLKAIAESEDPRIRLYGEFIKRLRLKSWTGYVEKIFRRNFRRSNTREAARKDRDSATSCTRAPARFRTAARPRAEQSDLIAELSNLLAVQVLLRQLFTSSDIHRS